MADETTNETTKEQTPTEAANAAAERMEKANKEFASLLDRQQEQQVEKILGGTAEVTKEAEKEDSPEEYAKKVLNNAV